LKAFNLSSHEWAINVQAYSGSPANQAVYLALLKPKDVVMGLKLSDGGHLTHGHPVNFSGLLYTSHPYGLTDKGIIDYKQLETQAKKNQPKLIISGATAYSRIIDFKRIGAIAKKVGAYHLADISHIAGLIVGGVHSSPFAYADVVMMTTHKTLRGPRGAVIMSRKKKNGTTKKGKPITIADKIDKAVFPGLQGGPHNNTTAGIAWTFEEVAKPKFKKYTEQIIKNAQVLSQELLKKGYTIVSGGTDNHLLLVDVQAKNLDGTQAEKLLEDIGILANRNTIPRDTSPFKPSGIRMGTPALTTRGMKEREMKQIARIIDACLTRAVSVKKLKLEVEHLALQFPLRYRL